MSSFAELATKIRRSSLLKGYEELWNRLRKPYHYLLNFKDKGVAVALSNSFVYRIPPQYYEIGLPDYEKDSVNVLISWIRENQECLVIDLGCSIGYLSAISLFASSESKVIAIDSDLSSVMATSKICKYAKPTGRLNLIRGLISDTSAKRSELKGALEETRFHLENSDITGEPGTTQYISVDTTDKNIPIYTIDDLFRHENISERILIKCDIEGAELLALKGATGFIKKYKPAILLSVHPHILPVFNHTAEDIRNFLESMSYKIELISKDHEEHWWCV
jgi:FkbM family methyltransferase